jgi:hypothetical protein
VVNGASTKVTKQLLRTGTPQTLAKGDKLTVSVERIDGGKLRCNCATWSDAITILDGEVLVFKNIERQVHALRAPDLVKGAPAEPDPGEDDFEGEE